MEGEKKCINLTKLKALEAKTRWMSTFDSQQVLLPRKPGMVVIQEETAVWTAAETKRTHTSIHPAGAQEVFQPKMSNVNKTELVSSQDAVVFKLWFVR